MVRGTLKSEDSTMVLRPAARVLKGLCGDDFVRTQTMVCHRTSSVTCISLRLRVRAGALKSFCWPDDFSDLRT